MGLGLQGLLAILLLLALPVQGAEVSLLRVTPAGPCAGEAVEVVARVAAADGESYRLVVEFRSGGAEGRLEFGAQQGPATLVASWVPGSPGRWSARTSLPGAGEAEFEAGNCPSAAEGRASTAFTLWPRWVEARPGDGVVLDAVLVPPAGRSPATLEGPAASWAAVTPSTVEATAGQPSALTLPVQVPRDASPGRTSLGLRVGPESLTLPVMVRPGDPDRESPAVLRALTQRGNSTEVALRVVNGKLPAPRLAVLEAVGPSLAQTAAELEFIGAAPELLNESPPLLQWVLLDLAAGEERTLAYRVDRTLPAGLPAWPIKQVNVIPRTGAGGPALQVVRLEADPMVSGRAGEVRAEVRNLLPETMVLEAALVLPPGWSAPEPRRTALAPGGAVNLTLSASPPLFTSGSAVGLLRLKASTHELERSFSMAVSQDTGPVAAVVVGILAAAGLLHLRTRLRSSRRRETLFHLREMRRRLR